jgi:diamine N-acetyltransferase
MDARAANGQQTLEPGGRAIVCAVHDDETPAGLAMISDEVDGPGYILHHRWKLIIDMRRQRRGYGTATLDLIVDYFRGRPGVEVLSTSAGRGSSSSSFR